MPIGDTPISQLIMERFAEWGCDDFLLMLNHKANLIRAYFAELEAPFRVECVVESQPLGTAGALSLLAGRLGQTFFLTNCDVLIEADYESVLRAHRESGNDDHAGGLDEAVHHPLRRLRGRRGRPADRHHREAVSSTIWSRPASTWSSRRCSTTSPATPPTT